MDVLVNCIDCDMEFPKQDTHWIHGSPDARRCDDCQHELNREMLRDREANEQPEVCGNCGRCFRDGKDSCDACDGYGSDSDDAGDDSE